mgnify:CR=1 FL=1
MAAPGHFIISPALIPSVYTFTWPVSLSGSVSLRVKLREASDSNVLPSGKVVLGIGTYLGCHGYLVAVP